MTRQLPWVNLGIKRWRSIVLGLFTCLVVVILGSACTPNTSTQNGAIREAFGNRLGTSIRPGIASADCRVIRHARGETCVPNNPQRVVVLGALDYALSLGIKPIGSDWLTAQDIHLSDMLDDIEDVGGNDAPNIEKILTLKPDFIIGADYVSANYGALSKIAPTVLIAYEHSGQWKEFFMSFAEALGKTAEAHQVMDDYYARTEEFKARMGDRAAEIDVSIVRVYPSYVNLYLKDSFCGTVVADAGLARPPAQDLTAAEASTLFDNPIQYTISREKMPDADGDAIFLWTYGFQDDIAQQAQSQQENLVADPLWSTLSAVQNGQVYEVPPYWIGDGPIAANAVLDDLFKYLVEDS
ncbi:iron-siderophore ABC transporter substrate-binding protein [Leptolyngbya sp. CCNP1308]|uniref:ABC transporter substrate-binding protein n=1 Tax=Leptolyngbya sp. CCNP1308 TaxID=3110255 RepID=UPI002B1EF8F9|nr:iron-siderophore ABC transporter substrate-binding protein [Leptolyngbya sp. CCNP1308]MEA5451749.1 iron-siderophore ABC transporter substrate-binding protein [Leptolyngbya sp. CCNP1308]